MKASVLLCVLFISVSYVDARNYDITHPTASVLTKTSLVILETAYSRLGHTVTFHEMPVRRGVIETNVGHYDADAHRIDGIQLMYPNLIKIDVPINSFALHVFSKYEESTVFTLADLQNYSISTIKGTLLFEQILPEIEPYYVDSNLQAFLQVTNDRADLAVATDNVWLEFKHKPEFQSIHQHHPAILRQPLYHYVYAEHYDLVAPLTEVLKEMYDSGEMDLIKERMQNSIHESTPPFPTGQEASSGGR